MVIQLTNNEAQLIVDCLREELRRASTELEPSETDKEAEKNCKIVLDKLLKR